MSSSRKPFALAGLTLIVSGLVALAGGSVSTAGAAGGLPGGGFLPDGRVWELVSPPDKNGGDVGLDTGRMRAAADGSAVGFPSIAGFADVVGMGIATDYMSVRSAGPVSGFNGWSTHGITPPQQATTLFAGAQASDPLYVGEFSEDLTKGVFRSWSPVTDDPNTERLQNLYLRDDLRSAGQGSYRLLSESATLQPAPVGDLAQPRPELAGASADFGHMFFESRRNLAEGAAGSGPKLYEWVDGEVRLAGILPDGSPAACGAGGPPVCSIAGRGALNGTYPQVQRAMSEDGARVVFSAPADNSSLTGEGTLYQRIDGTETVQVNASERTDCAGDPGCGGDGVADPAPDPGGPQPALFEGASADGMRVFFTTVEQLTDDDDDDGSIDLYVYDADGAVGDRLTRMSVDQNSVDPPANTFGVIGTSDDGDYVYFIAAGQIVAGAPDFDGVYGIYVWHDGDVGYIGELSGDPAVNIPRRVGSGGRYRARVTLDGRHLLFVSEFGEGLLSVRGGVDYDHAGFSQRYVYSAETDELECVSCNPSGAPATAEAVSDEQLGLVVAPSSSHANRTLSEDGRYAFFHTGARLVAEDTNGSCVIGIAGGGDCVDVYAYDTATGSVSLISSGKSTSGSYFVDAAADGRDVFFLTRERLSGWDVDQAYDVYDARVGGGFPEPPPAEVACVGSDGCQGPAAGPPASAGGGSQALSGRGNQPRVLSAGCSKHKRKLSRARKRLRRVDGGSRKQARRAVRKAQRRLKACRRGGA